MTDLVNQQTILIVDDVPANIDVLTGILSDTYKVKAATSGEKGLRVAEKSRPDLILLDIMMPGVDGYEVCERLKLNDNTKDIPVIFVTAHDDIEDETHGFKLGAVDYITKPVYPEIVLARVKAQLALYNQKQRLEQEIKIHVSEISKLRDVKDLLVGLVAAIEPMLQDLELRSGQKVDERLSGNPTLFDLQVNKLNRLLIDADPEALLAFDALKAKLINKSDAEQVQKLAGAVNRYAFKEAITLLSEIAG